MGETARRKWKEDARGSGEGTRIFVMDEQWSKITSALLPKNVQMTVNYGMLRRGKGYSLIKILIPLTSTMLKLS